MNEVRKAKVYLELNLVRDVKGRLLQIHQQQKEDTGVIVRPILIIFEMSWCLGKVPESISGLPNTGNTWAYWNRPNEDPQR